MPDPAPADAYAVKRPSLLLLACVPAMYAAIALFIPPRLFWDSAKGFEIWHSMERGAAFNCLFIPDSSEISKDISIFVAWWSPGQYLVPAALFQTGLPIGSALTLATLIAHLAGLMGWHRVWRAFGFDERIAWWSSLILVTQGFFADAFVVYHGGEALLFAFLPWVALLALRWRDHPYRLAVALPLAMAAGAFFKSSFLLFAAVLALFGAWRELRRAGEPPARRAARIAALAASVPVGLAFLWWIYFSRGASPASVLDRPWHWLDVLAPLANPWVAALEGSQPRNWTEYPAAAWGALLPAIAAAGCVFWLRMRRRHRETAYGWWLDIALPAYIVGFLALYAMKSHIDYSARHLRPIGLILLPGLALECREGLRGRWRIAAIAALAGAHVYCAAVNALMLGENARAPLSNKHGCAIPRIGAKALAALQRMDAACAGSNALFAVSIPEARGALPNVRFVHFPIEAQSMEQIRGTVFHGRVDHLLIAAPMAQDGLDRVAAAAAAFEGYPRWRIAVRDGWIFGTPEEDELLQQVLDRAAVEPAR